MIVKEQEHSTSFIDKTKRFDNDRNLLESSNNTNNNINEMIAGKNDLLINPAMRNLKTQSIGKIQDKKRI